MMDADIAFSEKEVSHRTITDEYREITPREGTCETVYIYLRMPDDS